MAPLLPDIDRVTRLVCSVADDLVVPRFRRLRSDDIQSKPTPGHADDVVTVADREAEARLTEELRALVPSAHVIGEEAAHAHPDIVRQLDDDGPAWIIDPLDGTHNFADGHDGFGVMVAYAVAGHVRAAWVHLPVRNECFVAVEGDGAQLNGAPIRVAPPAERHPLRGTFFVRYMPEEVRGLVLRHVDGRFAEAPHAGAAAVEYTDVLRGRKDFVAYYRLLPWDHGAPALILREAGGCVEHLDGAPYTVRSTNQLTLVTRCGDTAAEVRRWIHL